MGYWIIEKQIVNSNKYNQHCGGNIQLKQEYLSITKLLQNQQHGHTHHTRKGGEERGEGKKDKKNGTIWAVREREDKKAEGRRERGKRAKKERRKK